MKKKYIIVSIISVLIMMVGFSFAYFTSNVNGTGKEMNVSSKRLAIIFTDTKEIAEVDINPGWSTSKTFTVENRSGIVFYYDINIDDLINTFVTTNYLQYKITSTDGGYNMSNFIDIPKSEEVRREKLASNIEIENGSTHTYTIEFKYPNDPNVNQSDDMGKELSGSLSITESNIVIVKYKVNNVIQDEIPDKTEPYIVDKVECSNNAKGTWNDLTEKVDLVGEVTQTVCIVEFKEGNTVNIITENNEVVSPINKVVGRIGSTTFEIEKREGYEIENARVTCDNGASGSITGNTITIINITKDNTCRVETNPIIYKVTLNVVNGNVTSQNPLTVNHGSDATFTISAKSGYKLDGATYSCTGWSYDQNGTVTVSGITGTTSCTISLAQSIYTVTINSASCPDKINNDASPCYIIKNNSTTATVGTTTYTGCTISSNTMKYGNTCNVTLSDAYYLRWNESHTYWRAIESGSYSASCSVTLICTGMSS